MRKNAITVLGMHWIQFNRICKVRQNIIAILNTVQWCIIKVVKCQLASKIVANFFNSLSLALKYFDIIFVFVLCCIQFWIQEVWRNAKRSTKSLFYDSCENGSLFWFAQNAWILQMKFKCSSKERAQMLWWSKK